MSYVKWNPAIPTLIDEITCPDCKTPLIKLTKTDRLLDRREVNGVVKEWYLAVHAATQDYATVTIALEDGSAAEVPICKDCKTESMTPEDEHRLYLAGLSSMDDEDEKFGNASRITKEQRLLRPISLVQEQARNAPATPALEV